MVDEKGQVAPTGAGDGEPTETEVTNEGDAEPAETPSIDDLLARYKPEEVTSHPSIQAAIAVEVQKAEDRTRNKVAAESRRKYGDPAVVQQIAVAILKESDPDLELTRSQVDRLSTLTATFEQQAVAKVMGEIPRVFLGGFKFPAETLEKYQEQTADSDFDGAFQTLIDGAVAQKAAALEASVEKRVKDGIKAGVKAELEANGPEGARLPSTSKGSTASPVAYELTTAEIEALPYAAWKSLPKETQDLITVNASKADRARGKETVDVDRVRRLMAMSK